MHKQTPIIIAVIIGLVLTVYGGQLFLNIKAGDNQVGESEKQQVIQLGGPDRQMTSTGQIWTLTRQTVAPALLAQDSDTLRIMSGPPAGEGRSQDGATQFFIAGIILADQPEGSEERTKVFTDDLPQLVEASYIHPGNRNLAIN